MDFAECSPEARESRSQRLTRKISLHVFSLSLVSICTDTFFQAFHDIAIFSGRDTSRKSKSDALDSFRTVPFDDWLKLFLDVSPISQPAFMMPYLHA